ncbi:MAG: DUF2892 domain-containing protein [Nitrospiraceae bacterium]|nr:DUF2892 domain-containing protein [Nitrospiraceae bacterium]MDA8326711.1 DUF2892 domain-containing protein [Nitrospiraceae bacterium]
MYLLKTDSWYLERAVYLAAGIVVLLSLGLALLVSPYWLLLAAFAGLNLVVFALTGFCLMANLLKKFTGLEPRLGR